MSDELKWVIGAIVAAVSMIGGVVTRDRQMAKQIRENEDKLHERINKVHANYVKKTTCK